MSIKNLEYCKYREIKGTLAEIIKICRQNKDECVKLYPCAFFVAYWNGEI